MKKHFYTHLIEIEPIMVTLDEITFSDDQKKEVMTIVEKTTHYVVMDTLLSELSGVDKKKFLSHVVKDDHEKVWDLVTKKIVDAERKIRSVIRDAHLSIIDDIKKHQKK